MPQIETRKPWWRELWPWLLIAGPAVTVVGCIVTIVLAVQYFRDQPLTEGAVKRGLKVEHIAAPANLPEKRPQ